MTLPAAISDITDSIPVEQAFNQLGTYICNMPTSEARRQGIIHTYNAALLFTDAMDTPTPFGHKLRSMLDSTLKVTTVHQVGAALERRNGLIGETFSQLAQLADRFVSSQPEHGALKTELKLAKGWLTGNPKL